MKKIITNILLCFGTLVILLIFSEVAFRLLKTSNPKVIAIDRPNSYYAPVNGATPADFKHEKIKPSDTFRIAAIGDSFTFPTHMQFDDVYSKRLERMLNLGDSKLKAEVMNMGRMGAYSEMEVEFLKRSLEYKPDLVIIQITLNDAEPKNFLTESKKHPEKYAFGEFKISKNTTPLLYYWSSLGFVVSRIHNTQTVPRLVEFYHDMYRPGERWENFKVAFRLMKKISDENQIKIAAMIFPLFQTSLGEDYPFLDIHQQISGYLGEVGIPTLDLLPAYKDMDPQRLVVLVGKDSHPNEIAHRIAAEHLYKWLETNKMIPEELKISNVYSSRGLKPVHKTDFTP